MVEDTVDQDLMDLVDLGMGLPEKRERKKRYDVAEANKGWEKIRRVEREKQMKKVKTWKHNLAGHPWQFFNHERLDVLEIKRQAWAEHQLMVTDANEYQDSDDDSVFKPSLPAVNPKEFNEVDQEEYERLKQEGFAKWTSKDFNSFVNASSKLGRNNIAAIATFIGKDEDETVRYADAFWVNYKQIPNWER